RSDQAPSMPSRSWGVPSGPRWDTRRSSTGRPESAEPRNEPAPLVDPARPDRRPHRIPPAVHGRLAQDGCYLAVHLPGIGPISRGMPDQLEHEHVALPGHLALEPINHALLTDEAASAAVQLSDGVLECRKRDGVQDSSLKSNRKVDPYFG